jgi:hypothetical protein
MNIIRNYICCISMTLIFSCNSSPDLGEQTNSKASLPGGIHFKGRGLKVMNTLINKKNGTMSTLYGNDIALISAMSGSQRPAPGMELVLVTWAQQPNSYWYGNNIPGRLLSLETVRTPTESKISYSLFEGQSPPRNQYRATGKNRISFILNQKPSVLP